MTRLIGILMLLAVGMGSPSLVVAMEHTSPQDHTDHGMSLGPGDDRFDLRFIDAMILHHQGAVAMAEVALAHSQRPEVIALSERIIASQSTEIAQMQGWRQEWYPEQSDKPMMWHPGMNHMMPMGAAEQAMMRMDTDLGQGDPQFDRRFLQAMIRHHEGAVVMAAAALGHSQRAPMRTLAAAIQEEQTQELTMMAAWLERWYP